MVKNIIEASGDKYTTECLINILKVLRSPGGCPWDREQTHASIRNDTLEEAYEVAEAIDNNDAEALCEELGDMLLQVIFHSRIAEENNLFSYEDVVDGICRKLILRHPHVFGEVKVDTSGEVLDLWDSIKKEEKNQTSYTDTLKSVPKSFTAPMRAAKVQKRAKKAGERFERVFPDRSLEDAISKYEAAEKELYIATDSFISKFEKLENSLSVQADSD